MKANNNMLDVIRKIALAKNEEKNACNQIAYYEFEQEVKKLTDELVELYKDNIALYQKALEEMKELGNVGCDVELSHIEADKILTNIIKSLGYSELAESFDKLDKWYA